MINMNIRKELKDIFIIKERGDSEEFNSYLEEFMIKFVKQKHNINSYIGDYPSFIEPVVLGKNVEIGDDVLLGPNVFIGDNCKIGEFSEASNSIIFDNVIIGNLFKLNNCIIINNSILNFENLSVENCLISGKGRNKEELEMIHF